MVRRSNTSAYNYSFHKAGAFGLFQSNNSLPIEYLMTSFTLDDLASLSYARDINTDLNFDYLIQRDIDEERAREEISQYLAAGEGKIQKEIVFLPPILVAIVKVDEQDRLQDYYPTSLFQNSHDDSGEIYIREWPGLFKIENYPLANGSNLEVKCEENYKVIKVDFEQAKLKINTTRKTVSGARLVVIDGQHRLCALNYLKSNFRESVEGISVPVCIVYSPHSCENNRSEESIPSIAEVLRNLFVDVNSTVERVSGHFLTLLSDQTLGSIICREFCKKSLSDRKEIGLGLIEWNTKKHKESLEISREHTITSIGVINNALDECFKTKAGVRLVSEIIGLRDSGKTFDFGEDEYDEKIQLPEYFPWRDFLSRHKHDLTELVNNKVTPAIFDMFFAKNSIFYAYVYSFEEYFASKTARYKDDRSVDAGIFESVKNHILLNDPIEKSSHSTLNEVIIELKEIREKKLPEFARKVIFQKALLEAWTILCSKFIIKDFSLDSLSLYLNEFVKNCFEKKYQIFESHHMYLQDTIFNGQKIKVTKVAKRQIIRLILSQAAIPSVEKILKDKYAISQEELDVLTSTARTELGSYIQQMASDKRKTFEKSYRTNFSIDSFEREKLYNAEMKRSEELKSGDRSTLTTSFDKLVDEHTSTDIRNSYADLVETHEFNNINYSLEYEIDDEI